VGEQLLAFTTDSFMGTMPSIHFVDMDLKDCERQVRRRSAPTKSQQRTHNTPTPGRGGGGGGTLPCMENSMQQAARWLSEGSRSVRPAGSAAAGLHTPPGRLPTSVHARANDCRAAHPSSQ